MSDSAFWFVHVAGVEPYLGSGGVGDAWDPSTPVDCWLEDEVHLIRNGAGEEVTSSATLFAALADAVKFPPGSKVTVNGHTSKVIVCIREDSGSLDLGLDHVEVHLE